MSMRKSWSFTDAIVSRGLLAENCPWVGCSVLQCRRERVTPSEKKSVKVPHKKAQVIDSFKFKDARS